MTGSLDWRYIREYQGELPLYPLSIIKNLYVGRSNWHKQKAVSNVLLDGLGTTNDDYGLS